MATLDKGLATPPVPLKLTLQQRFPDVIYRKLTPAPEHPHFNYKGFDPSFQIIKKGYVRSHGRRSFPTDVVFERDVSITLRDGVRIYADVFRPVDSDSVKVPALLPWSPYGKTGTGKLPNGCPDFQPA